jgi:hypothetical protein
MAEMVGVPLGVRTRVATYLTGSSTDKGNGILMSDQGMLPTDGACASFEKTPQKPHTPTGNDANQRAASSTETLAIQAYRQNRWSASRTQLPRHGRGAVAQTSTPIVEGYP